MFSLKDSQSPGRRGQRQNVGAKWSFSPQSSRSGGGLLWGWSVIGQVRLLELESLMGKVPLAWNRKWTYPQQRSLQTAGGPRGPWRPEPGPAYPRRSARKSPRQSGLTSRRGLGRRQQWRDGRRGAGERPGHGPGTARLRWRHRRCFVSRAAEPAQPRESADQTEGGGGSRTVGDPQTRLFNPSQPARAGSAPAFVPRSRIGQPGPDPPPDSPHPVGPPSKPLLKEQQPV